MKTKVYNLVILLFAVGVLLALDLILKVWAQNNLSPFVTREFIPGFLGLTYLRNTGAAFGFLAEADWGRWVLTIVKIILMAGLLWYYWRLPVDRKFWLLRVPIIFIVAGGIGNLWDRITLGYVRDMLAFGFINFPIFNLADVWVVIGCFSAAFVMLFLLKEKW